MIAQLVYILCAVTSILCAILLFRRWRRHGGALLFWSTGCFVGMGISNILLYVDLVVLPQIDLEPLRACVTLASLLMLIYGLIHGRN